ncbi:MAG: hypothetical protein OQK52_01365 [Ignavibacteriaceae bacterium]|nr:hypothetical protein [Ignavibacteriaceae bacterium]MCW8816505.1 hypothetical protein [Ignavibacteriaceae bacterium]MCW8822953.1 hypothetical protein [Ignavibacteriaceae bacterium]MCW8962058.1 hypothetical protein [Ignavibacteriaceae bacterium]
MKRIIIFSAVLFAALTFNLEAKGYYNGVGGYFYTELAPYGTWIEIDYGVVVWRPTIIRTNWMPYNMGRWIWTYDGWYWDSYEPFGYITYHYGRWFYDDYYGWLWYPDYEWAPAWVEWRYDNDYIGWAPLNPYAFFSISIGIQFTTVYTTPYYHWHFVRYNRFCDPYVYNYYVAPNYRYRIYSGTKYRTNYVYYNGRIQNRGIDVGYIRTRSGQEIKKRDLIRVRDSRELNKDAYGKRDEIRTLDLKRDELVRNDLNRMEIKRENRSTTLKLDKVEIGKRKVLTNNKVSGRSLDRNDNVIKTERNQDESNNVIRKQVDKVQTENTKNTDSNTQRKVNINKTTKSEIPNQNRSVEINKKSSDRQVKVEFKTKEENKVNTNVSRQVNRNTVQQKTDIKRENPGTRNNNQVPKSVERKKVNTNNSRSTNTESRVNTNRTMEKDNSKERTRR